MIESVYFVVVVNDNVCSYVTVGGNVIALTGITKILTHSEMALLNYDLVTLFHTNSCVTQKVMVILWFY